MAKTPWQPSKAELQAQKLKKFFLEHGPSLLIDLVIVGNLVLLGIEVETQVSHELFRQIICVVYLAELVVTRYFMGHSHFQHFGRLLDLGIVLASSACIFVMGGSPGWMWRLTSMRAFKLGHLGYLAESWLCLKELWLVLIGFRKGLQGFIWFLGLLLVLVFSFAGPFVGLTYPGEDDKDCMGSTCFDQEEYFGSLPKAMLTMMQLMTGDNWAHIVRPLLSERPVAAIIVIMYVLVMSYGLVSVIAGVMVNSTIHLARTHKMHSSQKGCTEDEETVKGLKYFFDAALARDNRSTLRLRDLKECMYVPFVKNSFDSLDLPFATLEDMFKHFDRNRVGELTVEAFTDGLLRLRKPSSANDATALTATLGGSVTYVKRMGQRGYTLKKEIQALKHTLRGSFAAFDELTQESTSNMAEVALRRQGVIANARPDAPARYTS